MWQSRWVIKYLRYSTITWVSGLIAKYSPGNGNGNDMTNLSSYISCKVIYIFPIFSYSSIFPNFCELRRFPMSNKLRGSVQMEPIVYFYYTYYGNGLPNAIIICWSQSEWAREMRNVLQSWKRAVREINRRKMITRHCPLEPQYLYNF